MWHGYVTKIGLSEMDDNTLKISLHQFHMPWGTERETTLPEQNEKEVAVCTDAKSVFIP